uniref:Methyltransferase domain-containing protein n=1 Tax=Oreochromis aureus TaxID=47969 RepID=A0AAZ1XH83_OREAU
TTTTKKRSLTQETRRERARHPVTMATVTLPLLSLLQEFFTEDLWHTLPSSWQPVLQDLSYPQIADLLLDATHEDRRYPSVWPLSLLAFHATAHALAFPRESRSEGCRVGGSVKPKEFLENHNQSSLLGHIFRKHVKPKESMRFTDCNRVVDVGSGQGHLTRFLSFGLGLSVTAIDADPTLVAMASKFDGQLVWALEKEKQKKVKCLFRVTFAGSSPDKVAGLEL